MSFKKTKSEEIVSSIEYLSNYMWAIIKLIIFGLLLLLLPILAYCRYSISVLLCQLIGNKIFQYRNAKLGLK